MDPAVKTEYLHFSKKADSIVDGVNFESGEQIFEIVLSGNRAIDLSESYFSYRISYSNGDDSAISGGTNVSLAMGPIAAAYEGVSMFLNDTLIEKQSKWLSQLDSIKKRIQRPAAVLNGVITTRESWDALRVDSTYNDQDIPSNRLAMTINTTATELVWQPPLAAFSSSVPLHNVKVKFVFDAKTDDRIFFGMFETLESKVQGTGAGNLKYSITQVRFHAAIFTMDTEGAKSYKMKLNPLEIKVKALRSDSMETNAFQFTHNPIALHVCFQDRRVESDTRFSSSKFRVDPVVAGLQISTGPGQERELKSLSVSHKGLERPNEYNQISVVLPNDTNFTERYYTASCVMNGSYYQDFDHFQNWQSRGALFSFYFPAGGAEQDRKADVKTEFNAGAFGVIPNQHLPNLIVASVYAREVTVTPVLGGNTIIELRDI